MKKIISILCALTVMTGFCACGESAEKSNDSVSESHSEEVTEKVTKKPIETLSEISEQENMNEELSFTQEEKTTEKSHKDEEITLDSELECDYLKIATCSKWQEKSKMEGDKFQTYWDWGDKDKGPYFFINLELTKSTSGKMSQLDLQEFYEGLLDYYKENNENTDISVLSSFSKNGQAYIILGYENKDDLLRMIHFSTNDVEGHFTYTSENEDIVMDMIDSIEFKESDVITIEPPTEKITEAPTESETISVVSTEKPTPEITQEAITLGMKNALSAAKDYLNVMSFSYSGLIEQLEYEKYSHEEAVYGADNCGADWNEQAAKSAQGYIDTMSFSRQELIDQLVYEGFTQEQAEYGVQAVGY